MRVKGQEQRWRFGHDPEPDMLSPGNVSFVAFGALNPAFQIKIVFWQVKSLAATEQARLEMLHELPDMLGDRVIRLAVLLSILTKACLIRLMFSWFRVDECPDRQHLPERCSNSHQFLIIQSQSPLNVAMQTRQQAGNRGGGTRQIPFKGPTDVSQGLRHIPPRRP